MKIYCSGQSHNPFAKYIGKNVWIKVKCLFGSRATVYIRVLEELAKDVRGQLFIRANWIKCEDVERIRKSAQTYLRSPSSFTVLPGAFRIQTNTHNFAVDDLEIVQPLDVIPGEEIFPLQINNAQEISHVIGQPIWVKCNRAGYPYTYYYVRFNSIIDDTVDCDYIDYYNVDDYEYEGYDTNPPSDCFHNDRVFIDVFTPCMPFEVLTDEELKELVKANDEIYWKGYHEDDAGNYYNDEEYEA